MNYYVKLGLWVVGIGAVFLYLWRRGFLLRVSNYVVETREELKKCAWPSREELKGSTVVVMVTLAILAAFTVGVDFIASQLLQLIFKVTG